MVHCRAYQRNKKLLSPVPSHLLLLCGDETFIPAPLKKRCVELSISLKISPSSYIAIISHTGGGEMSSHCCSAHARFQSKV